MDIVQLREELYRRLIAPHPLTGEKPYRNLTPNEAAPIRRLADVVAGIFGDAEGVAYQNGYNDGADEEADNGVRFREKREKVVHVTVNTTTRLDALAAVFSL
jgi:hypothetical protein